MRIYVYCYSYSYSYSYKDSMSYKLLDALNRYSRSVPKMKYIFALVSVNVIEWDFMR
jgi:hypothetical protein